MSAAGPPQFPPDTGISDYGRQLLGIVWGLTGASLIILILRIYSKAVRGRGLWWDDHVLIVAWLCLAAGSTTTILEVKLGLGKHMSEINPMNFTQFFFIEQFTACFSILTALWSKTSFAVTLLRIAQGWVKWSVWFIIVSMNIAMLLSVLFSWIQCNPVAKNWDQDLTGTCWDPRVRMSYNIFSGAYSGVMDLCLAMLPWPILLKLQMKNKEKFGVAIAMSMGVFAAITAFIKCSKLPALASGDFSYDAVALNIWGMAEAATTIIATSIPVLRALVSDVKRSTNRYFISKGDSTQMTNMHRSANGTNATTIVATNNRSRLDKEDWNETGSDRSILGGSGIKVHKTAEVTIGDPDSPRDEEAGYGMSQFDRAHPSQIYAPRRANRQL